MPRGVRFAPSPTGTFHVGNLRTAWVSHWLARRLREPWVVRFEDIDTPRVVPGAQHAQLADLAALGLSPDIVLIQSARRERHIELFHQARRDGMIYPCYCSRRDVGDSLNKIASAPHNDPPLYSGRCRQRTDQNIPSDYSNPSIAWRFRQRDESGAQDFIIARTSVAETDFVPAYHWACAIDDFDGDYSLLVRAWDLAQAITPQRAIFEWLAQTSSTSLHVSLARRNYPPVFHTTLVTQNDGHRLEKRTAGVTLKEISQSRFGIDRLTQCFSESFVDHNASSERAHTIPIDQLLRNQQTR